MTALLTTVVGHYPKIPNRPRPAKLRAAIARYEREEISQEELSRVEDEVSVEVIQEQVEAGIDIITDGQVRWEDELTYFARSLSGFSIDGLTRYFDTNTYFRQPVVEGAIAWQKPIAVEDWRFAQTHSPKAVKAVITGPYTLARLSLDHHYGDIERLTMALAEALHQEALALQKAGAPIIQVSEPAIIKYRQDFPLMKRSLEVMLEGIHVEKALYTWFGDIEGLYPQILDLPVDTIGLDFVMGPRNFAILQAGPFPKKLGFGVVDARNTRLETAEQIRDRVKEISRVVPPEGVYLNPSCGLEYLPREQAQAKLVRLAEGAKLAREALA